MNEEFEWQPFTRDFDYRKEFHDVLLPDGTIVKHCWPNAGWMNAVNDEGTQRKWSYDDGIKVRLSPDSPLFEEAEIGGKKVILVDDQQHDPVEFRRMVAALEEHDRNDSIKMLTLNPEPPVPDLADLKIPRRPRTKVGIMGGSRSSMSTMLGLAAMAGLGAGGGWGLPSFHSAAPYETKEPSPELESIKKKMAPYETKEPSPELESIKKKMAAADAGILKKIMTKREEKEARRRAARGAAYKPCCPSGL